MPGGLWAQLLFLGLMISALPFTLAIDLILTVIRLIRTRRTVASPAAYCPQGHEVGLHGEWPSRYVLTPKGQRLLAEELDCQPDDIRLLRAVGKPSEHHNTVVDVCVALTLATENSAGLSLDECLLARDIRARLGGMTRGALVPDATVVFSTTRGTKFAIALEADTGSEKNPSWVARHKGLPYADPYEAKHPLLGCRSWFMCCVVPKLRRLNHLVRAMWEAEVPEGLWWLAVGSDLTAETIFSPVWKTVRLAEDGQTAGLATDDPFAKPVITTCNNRHYGLGG